VFLTAAPAALGNARAARRSDRGVTLIELIIVVAIIGLLVGISFPSVSSGIDSLRLSSAADSTASFLNSALNLAERRRTPIEINIFVAQNRLLLRSSQPGFVRELAMPDGVSIASVLPEPPLPPDPEAPRSVIVLPGGTMPRLGVVLANVRGDRRLVQIDPITGVPRIERPGTEE
jgi:prepilin-type N-terminal cleavage/methylation domain-containing protein